MTTSSPSNNRVYVFYSKLDLGIMESLNLNLNLSEAKILLANQPSAKYDDLCRKRFSQSQNLITNNFKFANNIWQKLSHDDCWIANIDNTMYLISEQLHSIFRAIAKPDYMIIYTPGWRLKLIQHGLKIANELNSWYSHCYSKDGFFHLNNVHALAMAKYMVDDYVRNLIYDALDKPNPHTLEDQQRWINGKLSLDDDMRIYRYANNINVPFLFNIPELKSLNGYDDEDYLHNSIHYIHTNDGSLIKLNKLIGWYDNYPTKITKHSMRYITEFLKYVKTQYSAGLIEYQQKYQTRIDEYQQSQCKNRAVQQNNTKANALQRIKSKFKQIRLWQRK